MFRAGRLPVLLGWVAAALFMASAASAHPTDEEPLDATTLRPVQDEHSQFQFFAFFLTRGEVANVGPSSDALKGQTIGRLFGPNSTDTFDDNLTFFVEQRIIPFLIIEPDVLDGWALLRLSFELDWTWGDTAYNTGGNFGGGFAADQVNLQTQNAEIEFKLPFEGWRVNLGLMRLYDNARDPYRTFFDTLNNTGTRLALWGSDATGVLIRGPAGGIEWKAGVHMLWENNIGRDDDVFLTHLQGNTYLGDGWEFGFSGYYLRDTANARGGVSVLGQGPVSLLAPYNGVFLADGIDGDYELNIGWIGLDAAWNADFEERGWMFSTFVFLNVGKFLVEDEFDEADDGSLELTSEGRDIDVLGFAANARVGYRYGNTPNDFISLETMFTTGDGDGTDDGVYNGVMTGNTWTSPGAVYNSHGAYLLFPHINVVNRYYGAVSDISNQGYGVTAAFANWSIDLIRNTLTLKLGTAFAMSNVAPEGGEKFIGVEGNGRLVLRLASFFSVEAHGAYLHLGDFFDTPTTVESYDEKGKPEDPWTFFVTVRWLLF